MYTTNPHERLASNGRALEGISGVHVLSHATSTRVPVFGGMRTCGGLT